MRSELQKLFVKVSYSSPTYSRTTEDQISTVALKQLFKRKNILYYGFKPTNKTIPLLDSKPENVIFVDKSIFYHFPRELLQFFGPMDFFGGGFIGYKARAMFFLYVSIMKT